MSSAVNSTKENQGSSLYAALAQTATRAIALYFSRPARLFRPAKGLAFRQIQSLPAKLIDV
jgi:hypothetical protein